MSSRLELLVRAHAQNLRKFREHASSGQWAEISVAKQVCYAAPQSSAFLAVGLFWGIVSAWLCKK